MDKLFKTILQIKLLFVKILIDNNLRLFMKVGFIMEKTDQTDLFGLLRSIHDEYVLSQQKEEEIYKKMNRELAESAKNIRLSYQEKIARAENTCFHLEKRLQDYYKLLENYSTFDSRMMGNVIAQLISLVECESYIFQEATHNTYEWEQTPWSTDAFRVSKKVLMVVKRDQGRDSYHDCDEQNNVVEALIKDGDAFILLQNQIRSKSIQFYKTNAWAVSSPMNNKFSYVKDFVDAVIQYRFKNRLDKMISERELWILLDEFILERKEMIEANYKKRIFEQQERFKQQLNAQQLKREEDMERAALESLLQNGIPSRHSNNLIDRLQEISDNDADFNRVMGQIQICYDSEKALADITCTDPIISSENIFISKIEINALIQDYFDDSNPDPHFQGECDIDLVDDGLIGIVDISDLQHDLDRIMDSKLGFQVDKINDQYLRILYLPNHGVYSHQPSTIYSFILEAVFPETGKIISQKTSYKTDWNCEKEAKKMLQYCKEVELLSHLNEKQFKLYKQKK